MRVIFMGTPSFAVPTLQALIDSEHTVVAVYCQPARPAGRGMRLMPSPIQQLAEEHGIPVHTPPSLKSAETQAAFAAHAADIAVVVAYGLLLPQPILDAPRLGCINIHPSDLPRWRGAAPIQRTLMAGDHRTACCIMQMDAGLDTGPVLARTPVVVTPLMNYGQLHHILSEMGASQVMGVLAALNVGPLSATPQSEDGVTYAEKITKADRILRWHHPAEQLFNQIRALSPSPAAYTVLHGEMIKIFGATVEIGNPSKAPGMTLDDDLLINAGNGMALRITELQRPNKTRTSTAECLQSFAVTSGTMAEAPIP